MEDKDSAYNKSRDDLAIAQRDLRVANNKIATLEKEIIELRKALVGEMSNLDRPETPEPQPTKSLLPAEHTFARRFPKASD